MSDQNIKKNMNFEDEIKNTYRKSASARGECPTSDELIRYQHRELTIEEMLRIKNHVDVCGFCDLTVANLSEFSAETEAASTKSSVMRFLLHPALAYGIVLALLYPAYRGLFHSSTAQQKIVDGTGSAMDFDLGHGSVTRSVPSNAETQVSFSPQERFFILTFFVPVRNGHRYEMQIRNEHGLLVDSGIIQSRDSVGNFSIVAASTLFPDGRYNLMVEEIEVATGKTKMDHHFRFRVIRK